jgi:hypothetical protein
MAKIASGAKILTFASTVDTNEKKSASLNANTEYHTTATGQGFATDNGTLLIKIWYTVHTFGSEL